MGYNLSAILEESFIGNLGKKPVNEVYFFVALFELNRPSSFIQELSANSHSGLPDTLGYGTKEKLLNKIYTGKDKAILKMLKNPILGEDHIALVDSNGYTLVHKDSIDDTYSYKIISKEDGLVIKDEIMSPCYMNLSQVIRAYNGILKSDPLVEFPTVCSLIDLMRSIEEDRETTTRLILWLS